MPVFSDSSQIILMMIAVCAVLLLVAAFYKQLKNVLYALFRGAAGIAGITMINFLLSSFGISSFVGVNFLNALIVAVLGVPGFAMLYCMKFIL